jgi:hypothetical protein
MGIDDPATWFNLGLVEKLSRNWEESRDCNRTAATLDPTFVEAHWNLGVAATALRDWTTARSAWQALGVDMGESGEPTADFGLTPVRLNATPDGGGEVAWGRRIDPCRARLESVPLPESEHRFGDVVLHDVVPRGQRAYGSETRSVFDELIRMDPSDLPTHVVEVVAPTESDVNDLVTSFVEQDLGAEDWSSVQFVCAQCSLADAHRHEAGAAPVWKPNRRIGLGAGHDRVTRLVESWVSGGIGRSASPPEQVF